MAAWHAVDVTAPQTPTELSGQILAVACGGSTASRPYRFFDGAARPLSLALHPLRSSSCGTLSSAACVGALSGAHVLGPVAVGAVSSLLVMLDCSDGSCESEADEVCFERFGTMPLAFMLESQFDVFGRRGAQPLGFSERAERNLHTLCSAPHCEDQAATSILQEGRVRQRSDGPSNAHHSVLVCLCLPL